MRTLSNGVRLLTIPVAEVPSVSVLVLVKVGSRYEDHKSNGLAHFTEHMLFQGNDKWPTKLALGITIDQIGAEFNGMTAKEYTGYYVKAESKHLELAMDVLSHMLYHSKFESDEIEKEKGVIVEEIHYREDNPHISVGDLLMESVFEGNPLGLTGAGEQEAVLQFKRDDFINFHKAYYGSGDVIVCVAGTFDDAKIENVVSTYFSQVPKGEPKEPIFWNSNSSSSSHPSIPSRVSLKNKTTEQVHLSLGMPAFKKTDPRRYSQSLLNIILGAGFSSRLFQKVREEKKLAYYVDSDIDTFSDVGLFSVSAGVNNSKTEEALSAILGELERLTNDTLDESELRKAKDYLRGKLILNLEESLEQAIFYGLSWLLEGRVRTMEEILENIEKITTEDITETARLIFKPENYKLAVVGKNVDADKLDQLI